MPDSNATAEGPTPEEVETLESAAHSLARGLQDLRRPTTCPDCLHMFPQMLTPVVLERIRSKCHEIFQACIRIVTLRRSQDEDEALRAALRDTSNKCNLKPEHKRWLPSDSDVSLVDPLHVLIEASYSLLNAALGVGSRAPIQVRKKPKRAPGHKYGMWPTRASDLHPYGAYETAEAHVYWCCELFSAQPSAYLAYVLYVYRATLLPHLLKSPLRERMIWCLVTMLNGTLRSDIGDWPGGPPPFDAPAKRDWLWLDASKAQFGSVTLASNILQAMPCGMEGDVADLHLFTKGYERILLPAIYAGIPTFSDNSHLAKIFLAWLTLELNRNAGLPETALDPCIRRLTAHLNGPAALGVISAVLLKRYRSRDCYGPKCGKGVHDTDTGKPFPRCSRCTFTQYCSRDCQTADWKAAPVPHKILCPLLQRLVKVANITQGHVAFETEFLKTGVSIEDCRPVVEWGALHGDLDTLQFADGT